MDSTNDLVKTLGESESISEDMSSLGDTISSVFPNNAVALIPITIIIPIMIIIFIFIRKVDFFMNIKM